MSITIEWVNEHKEAMVLSCIGKWTWEEVYAMRARRSEMFDSVDHPIDVIVNLTESSIVLPPNSLTQVGQLWNKRHPNTRRTLIVGVSPFIQAINSFAMKLHPTASHGVIILKTMKEALEIVDFSVGNRKAS